MQSLTALVASEDKDLRQMAIEELDSLNKEIDANVHPF